MIPVVGVFYSCTPENSSVIDSPNSGFVEVDGRDVGISFQNLISETEEMNVVNYEYLYNGGGVGVGDFNNDGLQDLFFTGTMVDDELYVNKGNFDFEKIDFPNSGSRGFSTGVSIVDINNDGLQDIYVCRTGKGNGTERRNQLYINNGNLHFTEQAQEYNIASDHHSNHAAFFDYDHDGDLDLYVLNHPIDFKNSQRLRVKLNSEGKYERIIDPKTKFDSDQFYENIGGKYKEVTEQAGVSNYGYGLSVTIVDVNKDGFSDIYVANDYIEPDILYVNQRDGTFKNEVAKYFSHISENSMGSDWADINNDGLNDLIVVDMIAEGNYRQKTLVSSMTHDRYHNLKNLSYHPQHMRNVVQLNMGTGKFSEIGHLLGVSNTDWSWAPLIVDMDNDGLKDLLITNGYRRDLSDCDYTLYKSDSLSKSKTANIQEYLTNIPETPIRNYIYKNKGNLEFSDVSEQWGIEKKTYSNGAASVDLNNDGFLDFVVNNVDGTPVIYKNEMKGNHYLNIVLKGEENNKDAIGSSVELFSSDLYSIELITGHRGYFSSVQKVAHFGLGDNEVIDSLKIKWANNTYSLLTQIPIDTTLVIDYNKVEKSPSKLQGRRDEPLFEPTKSPIDFTHIENEFDDLRVQHLLPHCFSNMGPPLVTSQEEGLTFIGGSFGQSSVLLKGNKRIELADTKNTEEVDAVFVDFDNDGDSDLYVVSGGNSKPLQIENYRDHFYVNEGGDFVLRNDLIPTAQCSGGTVTSLDYDNDGDMDLFIGGRIVPGNYPYMPMSYIFENIGNKYVDVTEEKASFLRYIGMVSDSHWADIDKDGNNELILCGEFMAVEILQYNDGKFSRSAYSNLSKHKGWWNTIKVHDIDKDGDLDIIAGNLGSNAKYRATLDKPYQLYVHDFDDNGRVDPIACQYYGETSHPIPARGDLLKQLPILQRRLISYRKYANCTIDDLFTKEELEQSDTLTANHFVSTFFRNDSGSFEAIPLPIHCQFAPIYAIEVLEHNDQTYIITAGNNEQANIESGPYDSGRINVYRYTENGEFDYISPLKTGLNVEGDIRSMDIIKKGEDYRLLIGVNDDKVQEFELNLEQLM